MTWRPKVNRKKLTETKLFAIEMNSYKNIALPLCCDNFVIKKHGRYKSRKPE